MPWSDANKGELLSFLQSVDELGTYVLPARAGFFYPRRYDADDLQILNNTHPKDLEKSLQSLRCACASIAFAMARMSEILKMGTRNVAWLHRMLRQLGDLDEEIETPPLDLAECRECFEVLLLDFFVQPAEHLHPKLVADPHGLRALFRANDEFMRTFREFAKVLQLDTAGMRAAYTADRPFYVEAPAAAAPVVAASGGMPASAQDILFGRGFKSIAEKICHELGLVTKQDLEILTDETIDASSLQAWQKKKLKCICEVIRRGNVELDEAVARERLDTGTLLQELKLLT
jgi:hypothetical protein